MNSPKIITKLGINEIFVFGSNLEGKHGKGAAKKALEFGAIYGRGIGQVGRTYAIPTRKFVKGVVDTIGTPYYSKTYNSSLVTLPLSEILVYVTLFTQFASVNTKYTFLVTEIGCNNAGYTPKDMAPLFRQCLPYSNILLPESFTNILKESL